MLTLIRFTNPNHHHDLLITDLCCKSPVYYIVKIILLCSHSSLNIKVIHFSNLVKNYLIPPTKVLNPKRRYTGFTHLRCDILHPLFLQPAL